MIYSVPVKYLKYHHICNYSPSGLSSCVALVKPSPPEILLSLLLIAHPAGQQFLKRLSTSLANALHYHANSFPKLQACYN